MKLLGWIHRKFRFIEPLKHFSICGQPSLDDKQYYLESNYGSESLSKAWRDNHLGKSFASLEENNFEEEYSAAISELFHGFLTIGTLGSDPLITDPSTPTFHISVENITEKETEVTQNDLKLINDELEKVPGSGGKEDGCIDSSGRNSHASTGRSSHGSTITLSGKPLEGTETSGNGKTTCPLQGYLFGSTIDLPETTAIKKKHRTSLGELFRMTKIAEESSVAKNERGGKLIDKGPDKSAIHLMKKMQKKRTVHPSSQTSTIATGGNIDSASMETKLHKILHVFHRKVHPESSVAARKSDEPWKNETTNTITYQDNGDRVLPDEDIMIVPQKAISKENIRCFKSHSIPPQATVSESDSNGNREYWIKTDADYLVLEL